MGRDNQTYRQPHNHVSHPHTNSAPVAIAPDVNMSREQYVPPTLNQDSAQQGGASSSSTGVGGFNITGANTFEDNRPVNYLCGDCDAKVVLRKSEAIRCKECGYRVLYKERTNRMIQFEAR